MSAAVTANAFSCIVAAALVLHYVVEQWLLRRQLRHVEASRATVPAPFTSKIPLSDHQRAADYTMVRGRFARVEDFVGLVVTALFLWGGLALLWRATDALAATPIAREVALLACFGAISSLISIPFNYYSTFHIEERFGFNKTTRATFWPSTRDQIGLVMSQFAAFAASSNRLTRCLRVIRIL